MPAYEFRCQKCGHDFELVTSMDEYERLKRERAVKCTKCGSREVVPQIVAFEVRTARKSA